MKKLLLILLIPVLNLGCNNDDIPEEWDLAHLKTCKGMSGCEDCVIIDKEEYYATRSENYSIQEVKINGNCLEIKFGGGGCSGNTWETELIDLGAIAESFPVQRFLKMRLIDKEECEAYIIKTVSFNITPLQVEHDELYLNIEGWEGQVLYSY